MPVKCKKCAKMAPKVTKEGLCDSCRLKAEAAKKVEQQKAVLAKKAEEDKAGREKMAEDFKKQQKALEEKKKKVSEIAATWRSKVKEIADEVIKMRTDNPTHADTINAGNNGTYGTTLGGTNNPLPLVVPTNAYKITKAEVLDVLNPDNSDSGFYKFRFKNGTKDIMVHCK